MSMPLLARLRSAGVELTLGRDGSSVHWRTGRQPVPATLLAEARAHRDALRAALAAERSQPTRRHVLELAAERAAIAEYDGGLPRTAAELMGLAVSMPPPRGTTDDDWTAWLDTLARDLDLLHAGGTRGDANRP